MRRIPAAPHLLAWVVLCLLVSGVGSPAASAGWAWSPQTGWIGPSGAVKDTPEEQLAFAVTAFERRSYDRARREFQKLLRAYKESPQAAEAQYYLGRCEEETGDHYKAFLEYRKTIQTYPSTKRFDELLEREYQIGNYFLGGKKRKLFGTAAILPARDKAIEVFQALVDDGPFSQHGPLAQYKLGIAHLSLQEHDAAVSAFEQLIARYPDSPLVDDARLQIAQANLRGTVAPGYDQSSTDAAARALDEFLAQHPESELSADARSRMEGLMERRAHHEYDVARFYERRKRVDSALVYYDSIVDRFPDSVWAQRALGRIQALRDHAP